MRSNVPEPRDNISKKVCFEVSGFYNKLNQIESLNSIMSMSMEDKFD